MDLVHDWMDAEVKADMAFIDRLLAEDWVVTDPVGAVWTKAQFLAGRKSGEGVVISFVLDNMKARVYGDAAVLTGRMTSKQTFQGQDISGQYQCTDMFIRRRASGSVSPHTYRGSSRNRLDQPIRHSASPLFYSS